MPESVNKSKSPDLLLNLIDTIIERLALCADIQSIERTTHCIDAETAAERYRWAVLALGVSKMHFGK